jgi:hypothetical protein
LIELSCIGKPFATQIIQNKAEVAMNTNMPADPQFTACYQKTSEIFKTLWPAAKAIAERFSQSQMLRFSRSMQQESYPFSAAGAPDQSVQDAGR